MDKPLISIIVPVFKVEKYINKCINSIISQTYRNLEIILVDDGSPDNCGKICDEYTNIDERIKVIHQKNMGLSAARNNGIKIAKGDYIGFVDSDDYIEKTMFEDLYNALIDNVADISICNFYIVQSNTTEKRVRNKERDKKYNKIEILKEILLDRDVQSYAWNKLYKKELFKNVEYPVGKKYEDIGTTFYLFEKCNNIQVIGKPEYNYLNRNDSIVFNVNEQTIIDYVDIIVERYLYVDKKYRELSKYNFYYLAKTLITAYNDLSCLDNVSDKLELKIQELFNMVTDESKKYADLSDDLFSDEQKIQLNKILHNVK